MHRVGPATNHDSQRCLPEQTYFTFCYSPIRDESGELAGFLDTVIETTAKVRAEKRSKLINDELAHRIQNTLTIVNCIADQTFRNASSVDEARALSQAGGEVVIRWQVEPKHGENYFRLTWTERDGPAVIAPERRGFGSLLLEHVLAEDFQGKVDVNYLPQGLRCELTTRLSNLRS